jgi:DNA polymerase-3 subunit epsilon
MQHLHDDLLRYQPLVVGHFMQFDYHMLGLGFYRAGLDNPLENLPTFCTMLGTSHFIRLWRHRHMRLSELYLRLFQAPLQNEHDALADASATAQCFFELWRKGDIDEEAVRQQQLPEKDAIRKSKDSKTKILYLMGTLLGIFLIYIILSLVL